MGHFLRCLIYKNISILLFLSFSLLYSVIRYVCFHINVHNLVDLIINVNGKSLWGEFAIGKKFTMGREKNVQLGGDIFTYRLYI